MLQFALFFLCRKVKKRYVIICDTCDISKLQVRIIKYLMCIYEGHRSICVPNMKSVCLTLWLGEVCRDHDANTNINANANNDDAGRRRTKHDFLGSLVDKAWRLCHLFPLHHFPNILAVLYAHFGSFSNSRIDGNIMLAYQQLTNDLASSIYTVPFP